MGRPDAEQISVGKIGSENRAGQRCVTFELNVSARFSEFEVASVTQTLNTINSVADGVEFKVKFASDKPGVKQSGGGLMVRAEPAIDDFGFSDVMIVVGGPQSDNPAWLRRARAMQRKGRLVVLLSDAATAYIRATRTPPGNVTTHWRDINTLEETGYHPNLTSNFSENSDGIITSAGAGSTAELIIGLVEPLLQPHQLAEISNLLLLYTIRKSNAEQPKDLSGNPSLFDRRVTAAIKVMETTISEPISMHELTQQVGLSTRHLERVFRDVFDDTPAKFYKRLRTKRARAMLEETLVPILEVALATGFGSRNTLTKAIKDEYGTTPSKIRARKKIELLNY